MTIYVSPQRGCTTPKGLKIATDKIGGTCIGESKKINFTHFRYFRLITIILIRELAKILDRVSQIYHSLCF